MLVKRVIQVLSIIGIAFIILMMVSTVADVSGRYLANKPITGTIEINRMLLVYVVFFALAYTQLAKQHARVDVVLNRLPPETRLVMEGLALILALVVMGYVTYGSSVLAYEATVEGEAEAGIINFPMWPGRIAVALGSLVLCMQYVVDIMETLRSRSKGKS